MPPNALIPLPTKNVERRSEVGACLKMVHCLPEQFKRFSALPHRKKSNLAMLFQLYGVPKELPLIGSLVYSRFCHDSTADREGYVRTTVILC